MLVNPEELAAIRERDEQAVTRMHHAKMTRWEHDHLNADMDRRALLAEVDRLTAALARVEEACDRMVLDWHCTGERTGPHNEEVAERVRFAIRDDEEFDAAMASGEPVELRTSPGGVTSVVVRGATLATSTTAANGLPEVEGLRAELARVEAARQAHLRGWVKDREALARVEAVLSSTPPHSHHLDETDADCGACWARAIRAAIGTEQR